LINSYSYAYIIVEWILTLMLTFNRHFVSLYINDIDDVRQIATDFKFYYYILYYIHIYFLYPTSRFSRQCRFISFKNLSGI